MLGRWTAGVVLTTCLGIGLLPGAAQAQMRFGTVGGSWGSPAPWGSPWGYGGGWGAGGYPGSPWGASGGWGSPFTTSYSGWTTSPGIGAVSTTPAPRARPQLHPAVPVDPEVLLQLTRVTPVANAPESSTGQQTAIHVRVPTANAEVLFDGVVAPQTGTEREYLTPPLENGKYAYEVTVRWTDAAGQVQSSSQTINFRPGDRVRVDVTRPAEQLPFPKAKT